MALRVPLLVDGVELCGWLRRGQPPLSDIPVLFIQGFPGGGDDSLGLAQRLAGYGITTLTYCHRGIKPSEGKASILHEPDNIGAALAYLRDPQNSGRFGYDPAKLVLGGYSYGGGNALAYAADRPELDRVFSIAGTDHGELARALYQDRDLARVFLENFANLAAPSGPVEFEVETAGIVGILAEHIKTGDGQALDLRPQAPKLADRDILLVGGWDDAQVTMEHHTLPLYRALKAAGAKRLRMLGLQDDHGMGRVRIELARAVAEWVLAAGVSRGLS